jgi:hypothetical protein
MKITFVALTLVFGLIILVEGQTSTDKAPATPHGQKLIENIWWTT